MPFFKKRELHPNAAQKNRGSSSKYNASVTYKTGTRKTVNAKTRIGANAAARRLEKQKQAVDCCASI